MNLYGASGHCKVIIDLLEKINSQISGIYDDNSSIKRILNYKVVKLTDNIKGNFIITIGNNKTRKQIADNFNFNFDKAIHPQAVVSRYSKIKEGTVVLAGAIISADVIVGKHVIVNHNANVDHDCLIDDYVHISPGVMLAGNVKVGEGSHIGIGAQVIQGVKIGKWVTIGAGAVVLKDIPDYSVVVGNPARIIKKIKEK